MTPTARLAEIAAINPRPAKRPEGDAVVSFLPMAAVAEDGTTSLGEDRAYGSLKSGYTPFRNGDVLVAKITPCFENGKIAQAKVRQDVGYGSTEFHVVRPNGDVADARYIHHFLRQESVRQRGEQRMTGSAGQRRVPEGFLADLEVPLPPLVDQRRIANLLDRADALRARRQLVIDGLDTLARSTFVWMFGNPVAEPALWPRRRLGDLLDRIESGWSPNCLDRPAAGDEWGVLKLGAVTSGAYRADHNKALPEFVTPRRELEVAAGDLLFSRKNTRELVAACVLVDTTPPRLMMPDLLFRLRLRDDAGVESAYLERLLMYPTQRAAVQALASGSAGSMPNISKERLRSIPVPVPPAPLQRDFCHRVAAIGALKALQQRSLAESIGLAASLSHRAFTGQL